MAIHQEIKVLDQIDLQEIKNFQGRLIGFVSSSEAQTLHLCTSRDANKLFTSATLPIENAQCNLRQRAVIAYIKEGVRKLHISPEITAIHMLPSIRKFYCANRTIYSVEYKEGVK